MRLNISPDTKYGLVLMDGDESVFCMFNQVNKHPDSLDSELHQQMYLTSPQVVPHGYRYEGGEVIGPHNIAFVAFDPDKTNPYTGFGDAYNMVMIEVTNPSNSPAIDFVRAHAEGGSVQNMANDLFSACFFKMMGDVKHTLN